MNVDHRFKQVLLSSKKQKWCSTSLVCWQYQCNCVKSSKLFKYFKNKFYLKNSKRRKSELCESVDHESSILKGIGTHEKSELLKIVDFTVFLSQETLLKRSLGKFFFIMKFDCLTKNRLFSTGKITARLDDQFFFWKFQNLQLSLN